METADSLKASSVSSLSPRISPIERLRHARQVHEQLQQRKWTERSNGSERGVLNDLRPPRPSDTEALATELQTQWTCLQDNGKPTTDALLRRIEKIGAAEKDALVLHLLEQTAFLQAQRNDVIAVGEKLTTKLVQQQHDLRVQFKAQTKALQQQLEQAVHHHPEVARLEETVAQLQEANRQSEQKLLFAVQKLHRSRQRERALRQESENDPLLWGL